MKYFIVSDVHSYYDAMRAALAKKGFDINDPSHILVICGDLLDRGEQSIECMDFVMKMADKNRLIYVYGNHEELLFQCFNEAVSQFSVSAHHHHNHTIDTLEQLSGINRYSLLSCRREFIQQMNSYLDFIENVACDYAEIDDHICVHGWIPCIIDTRNTNKYSFDPNWADESANWAAARWINGMSAWQQGVRVEGKTIVCGHWHTSWARKHILHTGEEWPNPRSTNPEHRVADFTTFKAEGIVALDACTAFTKFVNCYVIER